ncbi:hypothetical protein [Sinorhizobium psoraleae]|uniref:SMODS-associated and fused to various effectors domain-containing protein n=1 Tax=Sinorhizobium psoraleae TaxID=520838 RepID=A0ABT4KNV0_9HYPH|nr:hypothetical protein [Sinorhizobium psoraleae]MCZ4093647.1 hypothetical protein [Sinorhizobium psoraleae]
MIKSPSAVLQTHFGEVLENSFDLGIGVIGFEIRSSFAPSKFAANCTKRLALRYTSQQVRGFVKNEEALKRQDFKIEDLSTGAEHVSAERIVADELLSLAAVTLPRIVIDISSMSRGVMAGVLSAIMAAPHKKLEVSFTYSVAEYEKPPSEYPPLFGIWGCTSIFGGAPLDPDKPTALVIGVGYEADRAISAFSQIDPDQTWVLLPASPDRRYNEAVSKANRQLLSLSGNIRPIQFDVTDPVFLFEKLRALIVGIRLDHRVVLIPSGPKITALVSLMVAMNLHPDISVWRISSGPLEPVFHRRPTGNVVALNVTFGETLSWPMS